MTTLRQTAKSPAMQPVTLAAEPGKNPTTIQDSIAWSKMDSSEKIHVIRFGVPAYRVVELSLIMDVPRRRLMEWLSLSRGAINRKVQRGQVLSPSESERVMGVHVLIGQVQSMIDAATAAQFDTAKWLAKWLSAPLPALGGETPGSLMDTVEGQRYVGNLLEMVESGAYA